MMDTKISISKNEPTTLLQVGPLRFNRYAEPIDSTHKTARYVWPGGEVISEKECRRRGQALIDNRIIMGVKP